MIENELLITYHSTVRQLVDPDHLLENHFKPVTSPNITLLTTASAWRDYCRYCCTSSRATNKVVGIHSKAAATYPSEIKFSNRDEKLCASLSSTSGAGSASGDKQKARVARQFTVKYSYIYHVILSKT